MPRNCVNNPDSFCYICGKLTLASQKRTITPMIKKAYYLYFGCKLGDQDKSWAPHICCTSCTAGLSNWLHGKRQAMPFAVPMIWREPTDHVNNCYFCLVPPVDHGITKKRAQALQYPNIPSALRPVAHGEGLPVPEPPATIPTEFSDDDDDVDDNAQITCTSRDPTFLPTAADKEPHRISQHELNDLVRDLGLSKIKAELLGSRLQQWNLLQDDVTTSSFRNRHNQFEPYFSMSDEVVYCSDVAGLMAELKIQYVKEEWRLFIDSSKTSLKAVLLHNGNKLPSLPIAHAAGLKETYDSMKLILVKINYEEHLWQICGDLKVVALLLGLQLGYTKFCCFLCEWDSRSRVDHYVKRDWPERQSLEPGVKNVQHVALVNPAKVILPPLHIKLGLMKNLVKALDQDGAGFKYLVNKFPKLSLMKIKEGVFVGPQIRELMNDSQFDNSLAGDEKKAWESFKLVVSNFLGNHRSDNYKELIENLLESYQTLGCNMSLKIHFLHSHLDFFPPNCGEVSDEHGERFHQEMAEMEKRYQGRWSTSMLADYCWTAIRECPEAVYKRNTKRRRDYDAK